MSNFFLSTTPSHYKSIHNLKQEGSVKEYREAFRQLVVKEDLNESEEQMVQGT